MIMNTNFYGPKRVTEAFLPLIEENGGRIVNVSSGGAAMWLRNQDAATKALFSNPKNFEELEAAVKMHIANGNGGMGNGYGLSKAALSAMTVLHSKTYSQNMKIVSLSPGFVDTAMTAGF